MRDAVANDKILIIESDPKSLEALKAIMPLDTYVVTEDAQEAYFELTDNQDTFCTIVLGHHVAKASGEALIGQLINIPNLAIIPVVVHTLEEDFKLIEALIGKGARYYIPPQMSDEAASKVILTAIEDFQRYHQAASSIQDSVDTATALVEAEFCIRSLSEAQALANFLAEATPNPRMSVVGLSEIFINAIEHGNLGISYEEKTQLHGEDGWLQEVNRRLGLAENKEKDVQIFYKKSKKHIKIRVIDQGEGFDWHQYQDLDQQRALHNHGRGIVMAKNLSFDKLEYVGDGNEVECVIDLEKPQDLSE